MRNFIIGVLLSLVVFLTVSYCSEKRQQQREVIRSTQMIQQELAQVSKLIVSEATYSDIYTYEQSKSFWTEWFTSTKSAIVLVQARVSVTYDLQQLQTRLDESTQTIHITHIPPPEIKIQPSFEFYHIDNGHLNKFQAQDLNTIQENINQMLQEKIQNSDLMTNAENRLISELQKIWLLSHSLGWQVEYQGQLLETTDAIVPLIP